ncbi:Sec23/Sec24 trunk domain containing protein [Trichomonas vaginalis G3]|uniref:Protein transport protein SEC23 n=1 Tax=Trichomonas vaginalis (strain ATCC PRA-98 / G3) TaxID=412133 RepID=A2DY08_TRIV3|nr:COPII-coated vesicle budding [Trichomonas vaginalis G3]EAY14744.1 Sec23/Sec24 trunk domain containing protein [Trichomonas vaginalis G3]KAI5487885.1 COPII-coated vesicle budding [Trichomonas vaginalis G3]|eukprot:XP_001326967.1 Sec23/Sec24 trunk domain containing protein [Trichomonas vaginalis G3]
MDPRVFEDLNGIRISTYALPTNQQDCASMAVPSGCIYTPLKKIEGRDMDILNYPPVECPNCHSILNPYAVVDYQKHTWVCPLCNSLNPLPQAYHAMTETQQAAEIIKDYTTVEYLLRDNMPERPIFVFVVDLCSVNKEHDYLKNILLQTISSLPSNALVGLITFGTNVYLKELIYSECPRDFVFNGKKTYTHQQLQSYLSYYPKPGENSNNVIIPIDQAEQMLTNLIDSLEHDPFPVQKGDRPSRSTGAALHLAVNLIKAIYPTCGGHVLLFTSGPVTRGPGAIASSKRVDLIRQHRDIELGKAQFTEPAKEFFNKLGAEASAENVVIDIIAASFEEAGIHEMCGACLSTGGFLLSCETWNDETISQSLIKFLSQPFIESSGLNGTLQVACSKGLAIRGVVGPCLSNKVVNPSVSQNVVGEGGSVQWHVAGILPNTTFAIFFETANPKSNPVPANSSGFIQLTLKFRSLYNGSEKLRVSTFPVNFLDWGSQKEQIAACIDQQAAAAIIAKNCVWRTLREPLSDTVKFLDQTIINTCRVLGSYQRGKKDSLSLPASIIDLPQFMYHFRRSSFMQTFNASPDSTASVRMAMLVEDTTNCLLMMQPMLKSFSITSLEPTYVPLEMNSLKKETSLFLDTYFRALVWYGNDVAAYGHQGLQNDSRYANIKNSIEGPLAEAQEVVKMRFPAPQLVTCEQDSSLARYLVARCNPMMIDRNMAPGQSSQDEHLGSDEPSYDAFFTKLKAIIVK